MTFMRKEDAMKRNLVRSLLFTLTVIAFLNSSGYGQDKPALPAGWKTTGDNPAGYNFERDTDIKHGGRASIRIGPKTTAVTGKFGSLIQGIRPDDFRGKRIRFSGYIRTENVSEYAALWVRIDGPNMEQLDFSNMGGWEIKGTTGWKKCDLVVDVPSNAAAIVFGAMLGGPTGMAWFDDLKLETVNNDVKKTSTPLSETDRKAMEEEAQKTPREEIERIQKFYLSRPTQPLNLDFEQAADTQPMPAKKP